MEVLKIVIGVKMDEKEVEEKTEKKEELKEEEPKLEEIKEEIQKTEESLVPLEKYLEAGVHIGSKFKCGDMRKFIYKVREDGLCVLDISELNKRLFTAAKFLTRFNPEKLLVIAGRTYAKKPVKVFAETVGAKYIIGRFVPGTLTNPNNENFIEPNVVLVADPPVDRQVIKESIKAKIPVIALCDTSNMTKNIDFIIPCNNKGKKSLALIFWLLAREVLKERGDIKSDSDFTPNVDDFEATVVRERKDTESIPRRRFGRRDRREKGRGKKGRK